MSYKREGWSIKFRLFYRGGMFRWKPYVRYSFGEFVFSWLGLIINASGLYGDYPK